MSPHCPGPMFWQVVKPHHTHKVWQGQIPRRQKETSGAQQGQLLSSRGFKQCNACWQALKREHLHKKRKQWNPNYSICIWIHLGPRTAGSDSGASCWFRHAGHAPKIRNSIFPPFCRAPTLQPFRIPGLRQQLIRLRLSFTPVGDHPPTHPGQFSSACFALVAVSIWFQLDCLLPEQFYIHVSWFIDWLLFCHQEILKIKLEKR